MVVILRIFAVLDHGVWRDLAIGTVRIDSRDRIHTGRILPGNARLLLDNKFPVFAMYRSAGIEVVHRSAPTLVFVLTPRPYQPIFVRYMDCQGCYDVLYLRLVYWALIDACIWGKIE